jgi:hypothetical protein
LTYPNPNAISADKKVEFATGDLPPPVTNTTSYQFGFQFNPSEGIASSAPLNDPWAKQHISSVEVIHFFKTHASSYK